MKFAQIVTVLALAAVLAAVTIPALAQQNSSAPMTNNQQQEAQNQGQQPQAQPQTSDSQAGSPAATTAFQGTISRSHGECVLTDSATGASYKLDDQQKAKDFVGKSVKVTGSLDASGKMIHVSAIGPAS